MHAIEMNHGHHPFYGPALHWTQPYSPASECPHNRHQRRTPASGHRTIASWAVLDSAGSPVGRASRLPWELQPRPVIGDPAAAAPEPFRGYILTERNPSEPLATYTPEEARLVCPTCGVPKIHRRPTELWSRLALAHAIHCPVTLSSSCTPSSSSPSIPLAAVPTMYMYETDSICIILFFLTIRIVSHDTG